MTGRYATAILALAAVMACAGPYAERPPASGPTVESPPARASEPVAPPDAGGPEGTVIGHVTPDGRLYADTVAQAPPPDPVDRETVVTGHVRAADDRSPEPAAAPTVAGWRIQLFAAQDEAAAAEVARRAGGLVKGVPVYVEPEGSWFKVRLGDFPTREAAEPLREKLVGLGWTDAWAVRTAIQSPE